MDNLDRTNVVQAALAKWTLNCQLQSIGIFTEGDSVDNYEVLSKDFRESKYTISKFPCFDFFAEYIYRQCGQTMQILYRRHMQDLAL